MTSRAKALDESALQALYEISLLAADGRNEPATVARIAGEHARRLLRMEAVAVFAWSDGARVLERVYATPSADAEPAITPSEGMMGEAFDSGQPVAAEDYQRYAGRRPAGRGIRTALAVPLLVQGRTIGVIGVWSYRRRRLREDDTALLSLFAAQLAPAFEASRRFARTRERRDVLQGLQDVAQAIAGVKDPAKVAALCTRIAIDLLAADSSVISSFNSETGRLDPLAYINVRRPSALSVTPGQGAGGIAFSKREPVIVNDYPTWPEATAEGIAAGISSVVAVPLVVQDRSVGVLTVTSRRPRLFGPNEVEVLTLFAGLIAPDLEAAQLLSVTQQQVRDLTALQEIAVAASGVLDPGELARLTVDTARDLLGVDGAILRWWESDRGTLRLLATNDPDGVGYDLEIPAGTGLIGAAFTTRQVQHVDNYQESTYAGFGLGRTGVETALAVPLLVGDRAVGAIAVETYTEHSYDARAERLLTSFAALVGPALEAARLTAAQAEHEAELRTVYEAMACGVVVWDADARILELSDTGLELFQITRDELDGRMPADIAGYRRINDVGSEVVWDERPMEIARTTGKPVRNAVVGYEKPDGSTIWLQFDCIPVLDAEGRVRRVIGSYIDIGAVKSAEAARQESEAKSRFLASMSHELRTPLNSILGFTQLLDAEAFGPLNDRQRRYLDHIAASGQHLLELVNDILDLSKVAAGQMAFAADSVEVDLVLDEVVARFRPLAGGRTLDIGPGSARRARVRADRRRMQQVLHNLVSNAIKFTDDDGRIEIEVKPGRAEVVVAVRDSGIGIAEDQRERIFEEFTQVDDSRSRRTQGTGLGLPLSRRLVEQMGGRLWVESRLGHGSSFYFSLPPG